jgi:hypothetical protein
MPQPTKRTETVAAEVLRRLAQGEPLAHICRDEHMPHPSTWRDWCRADETLDIAHGRARDAGHDAIAADTLDIIDGLKPTPGISPDPARDKARADVRLRLLAKWDPRRYGDGIQLRHADAEGEKLDTVPLVHELLGLLKAG